MHSAVKLPALLLALAWLPAGTVAAPPKHPPTAQTKKKPKIVPHGRLIRIIPTRVTVFYSFKNKKTGKLYPMAAVSRTLKIKVVKPVKRKSPHAQR